MYRPQALAQEKTHSDERYLIIRPIEGKHTLSTSGTVDNRIYQGGNNMYAQFDSNTNLWGIKCEIGGPPGALKQKFTSLKNLTEFTRAYMLKRNLELVDVVDKWDE